MHLLGVAFVKPDYVTDILVTVRSVRQGDTFLYEDNNICVVTPGPGHEISDDVISLGTELIMLLGLSANASLGVVFVKPDNVHQHFGHCQKCQTR